MKTKGMSQQLEALRRMNGVDYFALLMEQGTGKTWTLLADGERMYSAGRIDAMLVLAPKGVHTNWVRREIPTHMDDGVIARAWKSGAGKRDTAHLEELLKPRAHGAEVPLRILAMNIDALVTPKGYAFALKFLRCTKALMILDESSRIKNPKSARTIKLMSLRHLAVAVRIASGTPVTNAPVDIFAQFEFMESGLLGTTSYRSFVAEYADVLPATHPMMQRMIKENARAAFAQVIATNPDGTKRWRNLDKLQRLIAPHSYRVLKKDCLDLPEKIYQNIYFDIDAAQLAAYKLMKKEFRIVLEDSTVTSVAKLSAIMKLQQITSGFVMKPDKSGLMYVTDGNPRLDALLELVEDAPGKIIVWARFKEELRAINEALTKAGRKCVEYHGDVKTADREAAVDRFQDGDADTFIGQPQSGGIGLTLTAAESVIYYSNDYNSETRKQSEDRAHRIGTKHNVVYTDLVATDTIDEEIAEALQRKDRMAGLILGDLL
jgi:SNF2 family DNA or RNA helicase